MITVVAAVFRRADKVLVCRKKIGLSNAGLWEFPGGKPNAGETLEQALAREVAEELHVHIDAGQLQGCSLGYAVHTTSPAQIELHCFIVSKWRGDFELTDHDQMKWCTVSELKSVTLSAADVPFVDRIEALLQQD